MEWFKKHVDTVMILGGILSSVFWMNGKFTEIEKDISRLDKEISIMKTVMLLKHILPPDLVVNEEKK